MYRESESNSIHLLTSKPGYFAHILSKIQSQLKILILMLVCTGAIVGSVLLQTQIKRWVYPRKYRDAIGISSADFQVPWQIIYAVIHTESHFDPMAVSVQGAMGLMQLMPQTYTELCQQFHLPDATDLWKDPATNIHLGTAYLAKLYRLFGDWDTAFAAYNAGPGTVKRWLGNPAYTTAGVLSEIPYPETARYVEKVRHAWMMYDTLYQEA